MKGPIGLIMSKPQMANTHNSRHRLASSLRTTGIAFVVLAITFMWIRKEMTGELVRESDTGHTFSFYRNVKTKPGIGLPESLSLHELTTRVLTILDQDVPNHSFTRKDVFFDGEWRDIYGRTITYDFNKWVQRRLDLRTLKYVYDVHDPAARFRNDQVHRAIRDAVNMNRAEPETVPVEILPVDQNIRESFLGGLSANTRRPQSGVTLNLK